MVTDHDYRLWRARLGVQYAQPVSSSCVTHKVSFTQSIVVAFMFLLRRGISTPQSSASLASSFIQNVSCVTKFQAPGFNLAYHPLSAEHYPSTCGTSIIMSNNYLTVDDQTPSRPRKTSRSHFQDKQDAGPSPLRKHSEDLTQESPAPLDSTFQKGTPTKPHSTRTRHKSFTAIDPHTLQKDHPEYIYEIPTNYHGPL